MTHPCSSRFLLSHGFIGLFSLPKFDTIHLHSIELTVINSNLAVTLLATTIIAVTVRTILSTIH
jgi:hypothetical protein